MKGTVKWFDETKGYGFINAEGKDYFVHINSLNGLRITENDVVEFDAAKTERGEQAQNVRMAGGEPAADDAEEAPAEEAAEEPAEEAEESTIEEVEDEKKE